VTRVRLLAAARFEVIETAFHYERESEGLGVAFLEEVDGVLSS
jgi:hypothetical protein